MKSVQLKETDILAAIMKLSANYWNIFTFSHTNVTIFADLCSSKGIDYKFKKNVFGH